MARKKNDEFNRKTERYEERMDDVDTSRFDEASEMQRREAAKRVIMNMKYQDPLYFPVEKIPPDMQYKWVRFGLFGVPDNNNMINAEKKGWVPVPASRHPEMIPKDYMGTRTDQKAHITVGESVLCERPKYLGEIEQEELDKFNYERLMAMPGLNNLMGEASMPVRNGTETYMSKSIAQNRT